MTAGRISFGGRAALAWRNTTWRHLRKIGSRSRAGRRCLVDHICDTAIIRADEDYRIAAILDEERMGACLRHLGCNFGRQRVKLDVLWYRVADSLRRVHWRLC